MVDGDKVIIVNKDERIVELKDLTAMHNLVDKLKSLVD